MTTLGIHYLTGYAVATDRTLSDWPEFPPHFGRVFMAMAAAYFETRGNEEERAVLEWLEAAGPPTIKAGKPHPRSVRGISRYEAVNTYVPVNDEKHPIPLSRTRQSRSFPTMWLEDPFVYLKWDSAVPQHLHSALERLCSKVTRIGHSSSLVQMWVTDDALAKDPDWEPSSMTSELRMRVTESGTLAYLEKSFNAKAMKDYGHLFNVLETATGKLKKEIKERIEQCFPEGAPAPVRPILTRWQGYAKVLGRSEKDAVKHSPFDPNLIIFTRLPEQRMLGLDATLQLTSALRNAAMKATGENVPEWLSGHRPDGQPSLRTHAAFFPLPFVGTTYADGHILGLAMAVPRELDPQGETKEESLRRVIGSLLFQQHGENNGHKTTVRLWRNEGSKRVWEWELERETRSFPPLTLRAGTWTRPSAEWASVTPVVLHHYPKRARENDVERILFEAFASAGLPIPAELRVQAASVFSGAGHVKSMPEFTEGGEKLCRYQAHVWVRFPSPVDGPLLVGRGRFRGYGLLRPVEVQRG